MAIEIGALLGQPAGGQSFENVSSWAVTGQCSLFTQAATLSLVHSSATGAWLKVYSAGAPGKLSYGYGQGNDAYFVWNSAVNTHGVSVMGWAAMDRAATSGMVTAVFTGGTSVPIPYAITLQPFRIDAPAVISGQALALDFQIMSGMTGSGGLFIDDLLVSVDWFQIGPDFSSKRQFQLGRVQHTTYGGREAMYNWFLRPAFLLPCPTVPGSLADVLNNWWQMGTELSLTMDSSNSEARYVVRLGGQLPPATGFRSPYFNVQPVTLNVQGLHGSLDF